MTVSFGILYVHELSLLLEYDKLVCYYLDPSLISLWN